MKSIDFKSLLIGILVTLLLVILSSFSLSPKYQLSCGPPCMVMNTSNGVVKSVWGDKASDTFHPLGMRADF